MITETKVVTGGYTDINHVNHFHSGFSWSAVIAGGLVALGLGFLLHLFSLAIGLSAYSATPEGASKVALGGFIGLVIGSIVSMGVAGFVAGYIARIRCCCHHYGIIYGFVAWSIALILSSALVMPLTNYMANNKVLNPQGTLTTTNNANANNHVANTAENVAVETAQKAIGPITGTDLAIGSWLTFLLFFIGALSSCIGAAIGIACKREEVVDRPVAL